MGSTRLKARFRFCCAVALGAMAVMSPAQAQGGPKQTFVIQSGDLGEALKSVSRQSGREIMFSADAVRGKTARPLSGSYTPDDAVRALLAGSGLSADFRKDIILIRGRSSAPSALSEASAPEADILVTGSRIAGAPVPSRTIVVSQKEMLDAGQATLGDVVRSIPQNFTGGQNPAIAPTTPQANGESSGAGTSINLRGLGQDATLTLLNGNRLANGGSRQSIDVSSIPLGAVDRIEIVADGASALYGSDAVAGVANIVLRRDYEGVTSGARFGAATQGGLETQQYSLTAGHVWESGGIIAAYEYSRETQIAARQRAYSATANPGFILYPWIHRHNLLVSAHQQIAPDLEVTLDGLYGKRADGRGYYTSTAANSPFFNIRYWGEWFTLAPSLIYRPTADWTVTLTGTYGQDHTNYLTTADTPTSVTTSLQACFCNAAQSVELRGDGPLFALPAGPLKIALGAGYRRAEFHAFRTITTVPQNIDVDQSVYYGFAELSLPLISPEQQSALGRSLRASAALRYEDVSSVDRVATPKLGLIYEPTADLDLRGSWGRSFKAPTLFQQYNEQSYFAGPARIAGGVTAPSSAVVILLLGGQPNLRSERATTWSATLNLHPKAVPGLNIEIGYFDVQYRDRVVAPIAVIGQALTNPAYAALVKTNPTPADVAEAARGRRFSNGLAVPLDPANVIAIVDNRNLNVATQWISGIDAAARYRFDLASAGSVSLSGGLSYIRSRQALSANQPPVQLAGTFYNPPHWRGRAGAAWSDDGFTASGYVNYIGGVDDVRLTPSTPIGSMTTLDLTLRYLVTKGPRVFRNLDLTLSVQNALDQDPPSSRSSAIYDPPYDSTNYSPVGRFVSFGVTKKW